MASSTTFDKILCLADPGPVTWWQVNKGSLTVGDDGVTFQGRKPLRIAEPVSVSRVHSGAWANDLLRVGFAQGNNVGFIFFGVAKRGKPGREVIDQLHALLQSMVGERQGGAEVSPRDDVASIRQAEDEQARANTAQARVLMIVGAIVLVGGLIVTGVSFAAASSGGAYVFAYGAMLAGFLLLIRGLTKRTRDR